MALPEDMTFAAVFAEALRRLGGDQRIPRDLARKWRRALARPRREAVLGTAFKPEVVLGSFDSLPEPSRRALVDAIGQADRWALRGYELGLWHTLLLRLLWRLKQQVYRWGPPRSGWSRRAREIADMLAHGARNMPALVLGAIRRRELGWQGRLSPRPKLSEALSLSGLDPRDFAVCYVRGIPQIEQYRGYWHDPARQNTVGLVLGLDFLPTASGFWLAESNTSPAQRPERSALYERDPFVCALLDFAADRGYRHLMVMDNTPSGVEPITARRYEAEARARKIRVTLVELPQVPSGGRVRSYGIPPLSGNGTLIARIRSYPSSLDRLLRLKRATYRALELYQREAGDPDLLLPPFGPDPDFIEVAPEEPFPNLVYKLPELEAGRGVYFLKANSTEHARALVVDALRAPRMRELQDRILHAVANKNGLYQAYMRCPLVGDRRVYKVRALVLLTPVGITFLSAHRLVSEFPVPEQLAPGIVKDPRPYLVNSAAGSRYEIVPADEERAVSRAASATARGLAWAVEYGFRAQ